MFLLKVMLAATLLEVSLPQRAMLRRGGSWNDPHFLPGYQMSRSRSRRPNDRRHQIFRSTSVSNKPSTTFVPGQFNPHLGIPKSSNNPPTEVFNLPHQSHVGNGHDEVHFAPGHGGPNADSLNFPPSIGSPKVNPSLPETDNDLPVPSIDVTTLAPVAGPNNQNGGTRKTFRTSARPECAADENLPCERDSEYDQAVAAKMEEILISTRLNSVLDNSVVSHLINDTAIVREKAPNAPGPMLRVGGDNRLVSETPACRAVESIIYPQRAKTQAQDWVFVVNQNMVRQGVRVEKCLREGQQCNFGVPMPPTLRTNCRQKFIYRKLLVMNSDGNDIQPESVLIPSCCVCYVSNVGEEILNPRRRPGNFSASTTTTPDPLLDVSIGDPQGIPIQFAP